MIVIIEEFLDLKLMYISSRRALTMLERRKSLVLLPMYLLRGMRRCSHCGEWYLKKEMVKIRETGWHHRDHPITFYARFFPN